MCCWCAAAAGVLCYRSGLALLTVEPQQQGGLARVCACCWCAAGVYSCCVRQLLCCRSGVALRYSPVEPEQQGGLAGVCCAACLCKHVEQGSTRVLVHSDVPAAAAAAAAAVVPVCVCGWANAWVSGGTLTSLLCVRTCVRDSSCSALLTSSNTTLLTPAY